MKTTVLSLVFCLGAATPLFAFDTNVLSDEKAQVSYALGMYVGHSWQQQGIDVDLAIFSRAVADSQPGATALMSPQEMRDTLTTYQKTLGAKQQKLHEEQAVKNKAEGEAFLATNKDNPGVVVLPDGLQYKVITNADGAVPTVADTVTVNYRGSLLDGTEFDSSYKRGQPASFPVAGVIHGWTEALTKMKVGSKWQLFIPSDLAYGPQGRPGIPPNSVLIFEVELLSTQTPPSATPAPPSAAPLTSDIIKVPSADEMKKGAKIEVIKPEDAQQMQKPQ
jgi:FKBP-type peptidyl-prolyl cis-trans isomerase FklB